jgi:hypothetical protein
MPQITVNEAAYGFTDIIPIDYNDLIALGTGSQKAIAVIPAGAAVELVGVHKATAAAGSTSVVFDIGTTSGTPTEFVSSLDADGMTVPVYNTGTSFVQSAGNTTIKGGALPVKPVASATTVYLKLTDAAVASLTAGKWIIGLRILNLGKFALDNH